MRFSKMGAIVSICAPGTMIPMEIEKLGCTVSPNIEACIEGADVIMGVALQMALFYLVAGGGRHADSD